jgi:Uma2 family endonuclease
MTVMTREPEPPETLLRDFLSLETPEGYRAQLIDGEIVVTPPPGGNHEHCISLILEQVFASSATRMHVSGHKGLIVPAVAGQNMVIPDLTFAPKELDLFLDAPSWMRPSGVAMVVEVTSSVPDHDRNAKRRSYAAARIPLYLLVGRDEKTVSLFSGPVRDSYVNTATVPFGDSLQLPEPFSFTLETDGFAA